MKIKVLPIILIITFLLIFFIFYKGLENSNIYIPENNIEKAIPSFGVKILDNNDEINSAEIFKNDKFYLMNIWASWCAPCKNEHPFLMSLSNLKNIEIIGLNYKDDYDNAKKFLKELDNPYKIILSDEDGTIAIEWGAYGVPESFLIYKKKIIKKIIGPLNENSFLEIKKIIR
tara:strand:+ start:41 stop:559 length:519 start_codon:yes stop_codon:yes gene_type:complete